MGEPKPSQSNLPQHIAIIMDGNGRWAKQRKRPRTFGHHAGLKTVRKIIAACLQNKIPVLTLFAFSSENWSRPNVEVNTLMKLFLKAIQQETQELHQQGVCLRFIGNLSAFSNELQNAMHACMQQTAQNNHLLLNLAVNYGGRWDITQAIRQIAQRVFNNSLKYEHIDEKTVGQYLCLSDVTEPDLLIRTSGECRISNFFLWQLAYTELYFTPVLWPDFDETHLHEALTDYMQRNRKFGTING